MVHFGGHQTEESHELTEVLALITLRHFEQEDAESIRDHLYPDMTVSDIRDMIAVWNSLVFEGRYFEMFAVLVDGRITGYVSLCEQSPHVVSAGAEIYGDERCKGYAGRALTLLEAHAAKKGYRLILDQVRTDNAASIRLHEKLGFEREQSVYRNRQDHEVYLYLRLL